MSENHSEKSEMSSVEFVQDVLRNRVAPPGSGVNVSDRIRQASRRLGWSYNRTKDAWYADPRISIKADEIRKLEETAGVRYGREEAISVEELIRRADDLLDGARPNIPGPYAVAFRALLRALAGTGTAPGE